MAAFAWRRRKTHHFGEQWIPFAELHLQAADGRWQGFAVQVDTGAVVSLLPCSAAVLLGIDPAAGEPVDLAGVAASPRRYHLHRVTARLGESGPFPLRLVIAANERVPNLLGRLDILDRFQMVLDPKANETRILPS